MQTQSDTPLNTNTNVRTSALRQESILKIAVLVSGSGSNLQVLIDAMQTGELPIEIVGVISNNDKAFAVTRAKEAHIETAVLSHLTAENATHPDSIGKRMGIKTFERHALNQLEHWQPDLIVLAGFMRVLSADFINNVPAPMINLHPSLLPKYKGLDTHQRVLASGDTKHGCSVHIVTAELDAGTVLTQAMLDVSQEATTGVSQTVYTIDTDTLQTRVQKLEHQLLPWTILLIAKNVLDLSKITIKTTNAYLQKSNLPALPLKLWFDV